MGSEDQPTSKESKGEVVKISVFLYGSLEEVGSGIMEWRMVQRPGGHSREREDMVDRGLRTGGSVLDVCSDKG